MTQDVINFKGQGLSVRANFEGKSLPTVLEVKNAFREADPFVMRYPIVFDLKKLAADRVWLLKVLSEVVVSMNLEVAAWASENEDTLKALASLGLKCDNGGRILAPRHRMKILQNSLRSGQSLQYDGDVVVLGNLRQGAEIMATGSIVVLGRAEGQLHAGCNGDNSASVIALEYCTNQLRIGTMISNATEPGESAWWGRPVHFVIEGNSFVALDIA